MHSMSGEGEVAFVKDRGRRACSRDLIVWGARLRGIWPTNIASALLQVVLKTSHIEDWSGQTMLTKPLADSPTSRQKARSVAPRLLRRRFGMVRAALLGLLVTESLTTHSIV